MNTRMIEQFADSPRRVRVMFRAALVILLGAGCYNWMVEPQVCYLSAAQQRSRWAETTSNQQRQLLLSIDGLKKKVGELETRSQEFQNSLFNPESAREFFCGLETQAAQTGCHIEALTFSDAEDKSDQKNFSNSIVKPVQASVIVIGSYSAMARFFEQVGQCPQKISIHEMRLGPATQAKALRCDVTLTAYMSTRAAAVNP